MNGYPFKLKDVKLLEAFFPSGKLRALSNPQLPAFGLHEQKVSPDHGEGIRAKPAPTIIVEFEFSLFLLPSGFFFSAQL